MRVCVCAIVSVYVRVCMYLRALVSVYVCVCVCVCAYMYVCARAHVCVCECVGGCMRVCVEGITTALNKPGRLLFECCLEPWFGTTEYINSCTILITCAFWLNTDIMLSRSD
jgi:hypothetical protein